MRFFHLSDLHIGLKLFQRDLKEDQTRILQQVVAAAEREQPDAILIAGDLYDKSIPSAEAVELFDWFLSALTDASKDTQIMLISGNHDSAARINLFRNILEKQNVHMIGMPPRLETEHIERVTLFDAFGPVHFYLLPFVKPSMVRRLVASEEEDVLSYDETLNRLIAREQIDSSERNVLVSHQFFVPVGSDPAKVARMDTEVVTVGNIDAVSAKVLLPFDYAALGHIHKPMPVGEERFRYCGTPLAVSVSEAGQQKAILHVDLGPKGTLRISEIPLIPLHQIRKLTGTLPELLSQASEDYVSICLEDETGSAEVQDRLRAAFPNLLEIRRISDPDLGYLQLETSQTSDLDPFSLCCAFLPDADDDEKALLLDVLHTVQGVL